MKNKKLCLIILAELLLSFSVFSQTQKVLLSNKIPVYIRDLPDFHINCVILTVEGGVLYYPEKFSGLEDATFKMLSSGSKNYSYDDNKSFFYRTHTEISSSTHQSCSKLCLVSIDKYFDEALERFADGFLNPSFDDKVFENLMLSERQYVQSSISDPVSMLFNYSEMLNFDSHPYKTSSRATAESIENITKEAVKAHYKSILDSRRISIIACGGFDKEKLIQFLDEKFGKIGEQNSSLKEDKIPPLKIKGENVCFVNNQAKGTGYALKTFEAPPFASDDYFACVLAGMMFDDVLFNIVREKNGICYTPGSAITTSFACYGYELLYRINHEHLSDFAKYIRLSEKAFLDKSIIDESNLEGYKNKYINSKYSRLQSVKGVASRMADSLIMYKDVDIIDEYNKKVLSLTYNQVMEAFEKYYVNGSSRWFFVSGPEDEEKISFEEE